ncbi:MAG: response regulator transcription factor [Bacteroidota bacterium]
MKDRPIQVMIVEDDHEIRQTLALIIKGTPGFHCQHTFDNAEAAIAALPELLVDVLLLDVELPGMTGIQALPKIKAIKPDLDCLMLTIRQDDEAIFTAISAGATGYLLKDTAPTEILKSIQEVQAGGAPMSMQIARKVVGSFRAMNESPLSERETEILRLLSEGMNYRSIAEAIFLSPHTVKTHIKNIYSKLHVHTRAEAINKAIRDKLI